MTDQENRTGELTPSAGLLAFGGGRQVRVRVHLQPVPRIVPANLSELLDPERDAHGDVSDWLLNPVRLVQRNSAEPGQVRSLRDEYTRWRSTFVLERPLGDVATLRTFLQWAAPVIDVSAVRALLDLPVRIDPATATRIAAQVRAAGAAARKDEAVCLGVAAAGRPGLVRAFRVTSPPTVVLAADRTQLLAGAGGLEVVEQTGTAGAAPRLGEISTDPGVRAFTVLGWTTGEDGLTARTDAGPVPLGETAVGTLLARVAPGVAAASTHQVPLTSMFADLLVNLPAMALEAARRATALVVTAR